MDIVKVSKNEEFRQGDLSFHVVKSLPDGLIELSHDGIYKLADSEVSGNQHRIECQEPEHCRVYKDKDGVIYLNFTGKTKINHCDANGKQREHYPIEMPADGGLYVVRIEQEYDPFEEILKRVVD